MSKWNLLESLSPLWQGDIMRDETFTVVRDPEEEVTVSLLYPVEEILTLTDATREYQATEGLDYRLEGGKLIIPASSRLPYFTHAEMFPQKRIIGKNFPCTRGGLIIFQEGDFMHRHQSVISYRHNGAWEGPIPGSCLDKLPRTAARLEKGGTLNLLLFGDSISCGWNSSAKTQAPPFVPTWYDQMNAGLKLRYPQIEIAFSNPSMGGMGSQWGVENVERLCCDKTYDLCLLAFGMNDGSMNLSGADFAANLRKCMEAISKTSPDCEFILILPIYPNRLSAYDGYWQPGSLPEDYDVSQVSITPVYGTHDEFPPALYAMEKKHVAVADVGAVHRYLLEHKSYIDMTGNNTNHPNDFLARLYVQTLLAALSL